MVRFGKKWEWEGGPGAIAGVAADFLVDEPEHPFGAWLTATETVECQQPGLSFEVPEWTVRPRGWYKGKYTMASWSKPRFHQVEVVIEWKQKRDCRQTILLGPQVLAKFRDHEAALKKTCGAPVEIRFVQKHPK
jgi:hypothetical protein